VGSFFVLVGGCCCLVVLVGSLGGVVGSLRTSC